MNIKCPYCKSNNTEYPENAGGVSIDTYPPIYYDERHCLDCGESFTVKHDDQNELRAIIKDFRYGHFYPDGVGLEE